MGAIEAHTVERRRGGPVVLRTPGEGDVPAWIAHELALFETDPRHVRHRDEFDASPEAQWERLRELIDNPGCLVIVACPAEEPERIIGDLTFRNGKLRRLAHQGTLGLAVAAEHRGTGIGRAMLGALLDWGAAHPFIEKISLGVWADNQGAIRLYRRMGFCEEARRTGHFRLGPGSYMDDVEMTIWVKPGLAPPGFNTWPARG